MDSLTAQEKCEFLFQNAQEGAIGQNLAKVAAFFFIGAHSILDGGVQASNLRTLTDAFNGVISYSGIEGVTSFLGQVVGEAGEDIYRLMKAFHSEFNPENAPDPALTAILVQFIYFRKEKSGGGVRSQDPVSLKPLFYNDAVTGEPSLAAFIRANTRDSGLMNEWIPRSLYDGSNYDRHEDGMATTYHTRPVITGLPRFMLLGFQENFDTDNLQVLQRLTDGFGLQTDVSVAYRFVSVMVNEFCFIRLDDDSFFDFESGKTIGVKEVARSLSNKNYQDTVYILVERDLDTQQNEAEMDNFCQGLLDNQGSFRHWTFENGTDDARQESLLLEGSEDVEANDGFYQSSIPVVESGPKEMEGNESSISSMDDDEADTDIDEVQQAPVVDELSEKKRELEEERKRIEEERIRMQEMMAQLQKQQQDLQRQMDFQQQQQQQQQQAKDTGDGGDSLSGWDL